MELTFAQKENIGFQYVLEAMEPSSPYGRQLLRELRPLGPGCRGELQRQLGNVHRILQMQACRRELQQLLRIFMGLKMVRPTAQKCLETELNAIELFEMKRFLLQSLEMLPLFAAIGQALGLEGITMADTRAALDILDPDNSRTASFFIPDTVSQTLASLRREKEYWRHRSGKRLPRSWWPVGERSAAWRKRRNSASTASCPGNCGPTFRLFFPIWMPLPIWI